MQENFIFVCQNIFLSIKISYGANHGNWYKLLHHEEKETVDQIQSNWNTKY